MRRGTTPTVSLTVSNDDGTPCDLTGASNYVTFEEVGTGYELTKSGADLDVSFDDDVTTIDVTLTQAETLAFHPNRIVKVQLRAKLDDAAIASEIASINVRDILMEGEI